MTPSTNGVSADTGIEDVVLDLLSLGGAERATVDVDFILHVDPEPAPSKPLDPVTYLEHSKTPIYTPSHVFAACLDGVLAA
jgi:hypothetical protein